MSSKVLPKGTTSVTVKHEDDAYGVIRGILAHRPVRSWGQQAGTAAGLASIGPLIPAAVTDPSQPAPTNPAQIMGAAGSPLDLLIIDTGAGTTGIVKPSIQALSLSATGQRSMHGANGPVLCNLYTVRLSISVSDDQGRESLASIVVEVGEIAPMASLLQGVSVGGRPARAVGILGRDVLKFGSLVYDGPGGSFEFRLSKSAIRQMASIT